METIQIKYFTDIDPISPAHAGEWVDLRCAKTTTLFPNEFALIPLGVAMKLPNEYEAIVIPRSSTFKKYGIIQTNSCGLIDNLYCGDDDQWYMPVYSTRHTKINKNDRICQFRIQKIQPQILFEQVEHLNNPSRGGIGSTGI